MPYPPPLSSTKKGCRKLTSIGRVFLFCGFFILQWIYKGPATDLCMRAVPPRRQVRKGGRDPGAHKRWVHSAQKLAGPRAAFG